MKKICLTILLAAAAASIAAQQTMSLGECIDKARANNKEILMKDKKIAEAEQTVLSVRGHLLPQVSASGIAAWNSSEGTLMELPPIAFDLPLSNTTLPIDFPGLDLDYSVGGVYHAGVSVQQPLFMGGKILSGYRMAKLGEEVAHEQRALTEAEVVYQTCRAYFLLLKAQQLDSVATAALLAADEVVRTIEAAGQRGMAMQTDRQKAEVARGELQLAARKAKNGVRLAQRNLCVQMGLPPTQVLAASVSEGLFMQSVPTAADGDIEERPEYRMLEAQVRLNREKVITARSEMLPQVGVQGSYGYLHGLKVADNTVFDGGSFTLLASVKIPLWQSGLARHNMEAARIGLEHSELERDMLAERMGLEQLQAANAYDEALLRHELSRTSLALAEQNMSLTQKKHSVGQATAADMLSEQAQLQKAQEEEVEAMCYVYLSLLRLMQTAGRLLQAIDATRL